MKQPETLTEYGTWLQQRAEEALKPNAKRIAGEAQCRWCKARFTCKALRDFNMDRVKAVFEDTEDMSVEEVAECLKQEKMIVHWFKGLNDYALAMAHSGTKVPGFKLVRKRATRKWDDEDAVISECKKQIGDPTEYMTMKVKSPAQMEKSLGKNHDIIKTHCITPEGDITLAPENDKRKEVEPQSDALKGFSETK